MTTNYRHTSTDSLSTEILEYLFGVFKNFWQKWPFKIFVVYVFLIFGFGFIYTKIHANRPKSFAFQADIVDAKNEELSDAIKREIDKTEAALNALIRLPEVLAKTKEPPKSRPEMTWDTVSFLDANYQFDFDLSPFREANGNTKNEFWILKLGKLENGRQTKDILADEWVELSGKYDRPYPIEAYQEMTLTVTAHLENHLKQERERLDGLTKFTREYWSYTDFVYFSAITQSTVGYGDILPNSTLVRVVVTVQVLMGIFLFVVTLNLAATDIRKALRGKLVDELPDRPAKISDE